MTWMPALVTRKQLELLFDAACVQSGYHIDYLAGPCRDAELVAVRRRFAKDARELGASFSEIGRVMHRHHTSVMSLLRTEGWEQSAAKGRVRP